MPRFTWGPDFSVTFPDAAPVTDVAPEPAKLDVELAFDRVDRQAGTVHLSLPPYDAATHVQPDRVHAVLFPAGQTIDETPETAIAGPAPKSFTDVPQYAGGIDLVIPRPEGAVAGVPYTGKTVLQFGL